MSEQQSGIDKGDSLVDAWAAVALIAIVVFTAVFWVAGQ
jgi:hypothetical protein